MINYLKKISTLIISAIILSSSISVYAQYDELRIYSGKDVYSIPAAAKGDNVFFSVEDFAKALDISEIKKQIVAIQKVRLYLDEYRYR